jgi:hypothetical protein
MVCAPQELCRKIVGHVGLDGILICAICQSASGVWSDSERKNLKLFKTKLIFNFKNDYEISFKDFLNKLEFEFSAYFAHFI